MLAFSSDTVFGYGRKPEFQINSPVYEYRLFAAPRNVSLEDYKQAIAKVTEEGKPKRRAPVAITLPQDNPVARWYLRGFKNAQVNAVIADLAPVIVAPPP